MQTRTNGSTQGNGHQSNTQARMVVLGARLNMMNGKPLDADEQYKAVKAALSDGFNVDDVVRIMHLDKTYVNNIDKERQAESRAQRLGVSIAPLNRTQLRALGSTAIRDEVWTDAASLIGDVKMSGKDTTAFLKHLADPVAVASDNDARLLIAAERETKKDQIEANKTEAASRNGKSNPTDEMRRALGVVDKYKNAPELVLERNPLRKADFLALLREAEHALGLFIQAQEDDIANSAI